MQRGKMKFHSTKLPYWQEARTCQRRKNQPRDLEGTELASKKIDVQYFESTSGGKQKKGENGTPDDRTIKSTNLRGGTSSHRRGRVCLVLQYPTSTSTGRGNGDWDVDGDREGTRRSNQNLDWPKKTRQEKEEENWNISTQREKEREREHFW